MDSKAVLQPIEINPVSSTWRVSGELSIQQSNVYCCSSRRMALAVHFSFLNRGIMLWIELPWPENPANTYAWHTETLDCCFDLIRSHQHCIPWSPPLEIKPATTDGRAETLQLSPQSISHTSDAKLTSHGNCTAN